MSSGTQIVPINRDNANTAQIQNLLNVIMALTGAANHGSEENGGTMDGGTRAALHTSVIMACNRLDILLADPSRWNVGDSDVYRAMLEENTKLIQSQKAAYDQSHSPHARYKPQLIKLRNGQWLAIAGNVNDLDNALCGLGGCPAEAIQAFDELFNGKVPESLAKFLAEQETKPNEKPLDTGRNPNPEEPKKPKRPGRRNRPQDGSVPPVDNK